MGFRLQISCRVDTASVDNLEKYAKLSLLATGMPLSGGSGGHACYQSLQNPRQIGECYSPPIPR